MNGVISFFQCLFTQTMLLLLFLLTLLYYLPYIQQKVLTQDTLYLLMIYMPIVLLTSRGSQILANYHQKQTGAQSRATTGMNLIGSVIRTVTTIKEVGWDLHILRSYGVSITLNVILFMQIVLYGENTKKIFGDLKKKQKQKTKKKEE